MLETAGRHWATEVVAGPGRAISNGLTIPGFAERYADPVRGRAAACRTRRARTEHAAGLAGGPADLFAALRDHGPDGPSWSPVNGSLSAPCVHGGGVVTGSQTTASWVADLRAEPRHWVTATSAPCLSIFKPIAVGPVPEDPTPSDPPAMPTNRFDPSYRWWRHELLHRAALRGLPAALARIAPERDAREAAWLADPPSTAEAFAAADALTARWTAELTTTDSRPWWLRRQWAGWDKDARRTG